MKHSVYVFARRCSYEAELAKLAKTVRVEIQLPLTFEVVQESLITNLYEKHRKNTQICAFEP